VGGVSNSLVVLLLAAWFVATANSRGQPSFPTNGLYAHYPFHAGLRDESPAATNALALRTLWAADRRASVDSQSICFRRVVSTNDSYVRTNLAALLMAGPPLDEPTVSSFRYGNRYSISAWLKPDVGSEGVWFFSPRLGRSTLQRETNGWAISWSLDLKAETSPNSVESYIPQLDVSAAEFTAFAKAAGAPGPWHHLVLVEDKPGSIHDRSVPGSMSLYVDGRLAKAAQFPIHRGSLSFYRPLEMAFGCTVRWEPLPPRDPYASPPGYSGSIDDIRIYRRPLDAAEVRALYETERLPIASAHLLPGLAPGRLRLVTGIRPGSTFRFESSADLLKWAVHEPDAVAQPEGWVLDVPAVAPRSFFRLRDVRELMVDSPIILREPEPAVLPLGQPLTLGGAAAGEEPLQYRWLHKGTPVAGGVGPSLKIARTDRSHGGLYSLVVSNRLGVAQTRSVLVQIGVPPSVQSGPTDLTVLYPINPNNPGRRSIYMPPEYKVGRANSLQVVAAGDPPLSHFWRGDGILTTPGGPDLLVKLDRGPFTTSSSQIVPTDLSLGGPSIFQAVVTNLFGRATSQVATVTILGAPRITSEGPDLKVPVGGRGMLRVSVDGTPTFLCRWFRNGEAATEPVNFEVRKPGAVELQVSALGDYQFLAANAYGYVRSRIFKVTR